ncbi:MAG TPA: D-aminoacyl-tRNA deacylase [Burkholderiales bacterium]|nr:D-aminoacyl-tRNA deacylase [Burkholderiales bacterium]
MIGLLQRVSEAQVEVEGRRICAIGPGLLVLACAERGDSKREAERLVERILDYRVFSDGNGKMNLSLRDVAGALLLVPQFTLAADTTKGKRPSFTPAAPPQEGQRLFEYFLACARASHAPVASGEFGAHMRVSLVNDGPVTIWLQVVAQNGNRTAAGFSEQPA